MNQFNPMPPTVMHIDINSCFATIEQQANPHLRGKPTVVAAYTTGNGCILAASREAKHVGITTGMPVSKAKKYCPTVIVLAPDPEKYRFIHHELVELLSSYTPILEEQSIDEMVLQFASTPVLNEYLAGGQPVLAAMRLIAMDIKRAIRKTIGEWITVSIGISTNRYLAKLASNLEKPDGLSDITADSIKTVLQILTLPQLIGIKGGLTHRLLTCGITTPSALYENSPQRVNHAIRSKVGEQFWFWLHGWETEKTWGNVAPPKTIGHSFALYRPLLPTNPGLLGILRQLTDKTGWRLREAGFASHGVHVCCFLSDHSCWHQGMLASQTFYTNQQIFDYARHILFKAPQIPIRLLSVHLYQLLPMHGEQLSLDNTDQKQESVTKAHDAIIAKFGAGSIMPASILLSSQRVIDRIAFGKIKSTTAH